MQIFVKIYKNHNLPTEHTTQIREFFGHLQLNQPSLYNLIQTHLLTFYQTDEQINKNKSCDIDILKKIEASHSSSNHNTKTEKIISITTNKHL